MRRFVLFRLVAGLGLALVALSACQSENRPMTVAAAQPRGIEGRWSSVGGPIAYNAIFQNGRFTSVERATNGLLASGSYSRIGPGQVSVVYTSTTRNQQVAANCNQVQPNLLSCATSSGNRFDLSRA